MIISLNSAVSQNMPNKIAVNLGPCIQLILLVSNTMLKNIDFKYVCSQGVVTHNYMDGPKLNCLNNLLVLNTTHLFLFPCGTY